jgi:hypothetical protein
VSAIVSEVFCGFPQSLHTMPDITQYQTNKRFPLYYLHYPLTCHHFADCPAATTDVIITHLTKTRTLPIPCITLHKRHRTSDGWQPLAHCSVQRTDTANHRPILCKASPFDRRRSNQVWWIGGPFVYARLSDVICWTSYCNADCRLMLDCCSILFNTVQYCSLLFNTVQYCSIKQR